MVFNYVVANGAVAVCVEKNCAETRRAGTSCAETVPNQTKPLPCCDTVGWATGRATGL